MDASDRRIDWMSVLTDLRRVVGNEVSSDSSITGRDRFLA